MKTDRKAVYNKYGGVCAYCGDSIDFKDMQIDHLHAKKLYEGSAIKEYDGDINELKNLMPSCRMCNFYKSNCDLEVFRNELRLIAERRLLKIFIVRLALKYGILTLRPFKGIFYFEQVEAEEINKQ